MLSKRAKFIFGVQMNISCLIGSIPFYWDFKEEKLCTSPQTSLLYIKWLLSTYIIFLHGFILGAKLINCISNGCSDSGVQLFFHFFWTLGMAFPICFDLTTLIHERELVQFVNQTFRMDDYFTSKSAV